MSIPASYKAHAARAIAAIEPTLDLWRGGFGVEHHDALNRACVATALAFIDCGPVMRVGLKSRKARNSYGLKHTAENWGRHLGFEPYIANGDLICAALYRGIPITRYDRRSPNCTVALGVIQEAGCLQPHTFGPQETRR